MLHVKSSLEKYKIHGIYHVHLGKNIPDYVQDVARIKCRS